MTPVDESGTSATNARPALTGPAAATAAPAAQPVAAPVAARGSSAGGQLLASVIGHLAFGALVLGGVLFWQNYPKVLTPMADTVCADHLLGQYRSPAGNELASVAGARDKSAAAAAVSGADTKPASAPASPKTDEPARVAANAVQPTPPAASSAAAAGATADAADAPQATASGAKPATGTVPGPAVTPGSERGGVAGEREPSALPQPTQTRPVATVPQPAPAASMATTGAPPGMAAAAPAASVAAATSAAASAPPAATAAGGAASAQPAKPTPPAASASLSERWQSARMAYRSGKTEAIESYAQLIKDFPDVADLPGELGNIYYGAGRMQDAAEQYFEAAQRHLRGPTPGMASCLAGVLKRLNSPLADKLAEQAKAPCPLTTQDAGKGARSG